MILEALLSIVKAFLILIMSPINFPSLPEGLLTVLHDLKFSQAIASGLSIIACYTHFAFLSGLFLTIMVFRTLEFLYKWICWVLRKIPILNVRG